MPPSKSRTLQEDGRPDLPVTKDKLASITQNATGPRGGRRSGNAVMTNGSSLKEVVSTSDVAAMDRFDSSATASGGGNGVRWDYYISLS